MISDKKTSAQNIPKQLFPSPLFFSHIAASLVFWPFFLYIFPFLNISEKKILFQLIFHKPVENCNLTKCAYELGIPS